MTGLVEWLRAALDDAERRVEGMTFSDWTDAYMEASAAARRFIAMRDPVQVLRTVQAHREILDLHHPIDYGAGVDCAKCDAGDPWPCKTVRALAGIYRESFPGFDPSWIGES